MSQFSRSLTPSPFFSALFLGLILWGASPGEGRAQSEIFRFFSPEMGFLKTTLNFQATPYKTEEVAAQSKDFGATLYNASLLFPFVQDRDTEGGLLGNFRGQDIRTEAVLPDTRQKFPDGLWDASLGPFYRHRFENGWIGGGFLTLGSASDRLFASIQETELRATFFLRLPDGKQNAWIASLTYSNNREFLNNVPLPGLAYSFEPSDRARLLIGFPFLSFEGKPTRDLSLEFSYFWVRSVRSRISYVLMPPLRAYAGFDWRNESYFLADRQDRWDRLFYYEKRIYAGMRWDLSKHVFFDLASGYAFDRFYFEGQDYQDREHNRVSVGNGPFITLLGGLRF